MKYVVSENNLRDVLSYVNIILMERNVKYDANEIQSELDILYETDRISFTCLPTKYGQVEISEIMFDTKEDYLLFTLKYAGR